MGRTFPCAHFSKPENYFPKRKTEAGTETKVKWRGFLHGPVLSQTAPSPHGEADTLACLRPPPPPPASFPPPRQGGAPIAALHVCSGPGHTVGTRALFWPGNTEPRRGSHRPPPGAPRQGQNQSADPSLAPATRRAGSLWVLPRRCLCAVPSSARAHGSLTR